MVLAGDTQCYCEINDGFDVRALINNVRPAFIFHLAANSTTSEECVFENHNTIGTGTLNILEAIDRLKISTRVFIAGSALQFMNKGAPIREDHPRSSESGYAVLRNYATDLARYYRGRGVNVFTGFLFHHESPRRKDRHVSQVIARLARQARDHVIDAALVEDQKLAIGDLSVQKEWTFAGDTVAAIWTLVNQGIDHDSGNGSGTIWEANIGTGEGFSIEEWADECFAIANLDWRDYITERSDFVPEYRRLVADSRRIRSLGWRPKFNFRDLARMMVAGNGE